MITTHKRNAAGGFSVQEQSLGKLEGYSQILHCIFYQCGHDINLHQNLMLKPLGCKGRHNTGT